MAAIDDLQAKAESAQTKLQDLQQKLAAFVEGNSGGATEQQVVALNGTMDGINQGLDQLITIVTPAQPAS